MIGEALGKIIEAVGITGILTTLVITVAVWMYYDFSDLQETLSAQETTGVFVICLILVTSIRLIYIAFKNKREDR